MNRADLESVVAAGLIGEWPSPRVEVTGDDPIHRSTIPVGRGATAALAMVATALDDIWAHRTGRRQQITIDLRHAALALSSMWLLRADGRRAVETLMPDRAVTAGMFESSDGRRLWLQDTSPSLQAKALAALGCERDADAVRATIASQTSAELEQLFVEHGLTGVIVRTPDEWWQHPQGAILREAPVVEIERFADGPVVPLPERERPLGGLRVLEDTRVLAGPTIARTLAEFGADVLQVGAPRHIDEDLVAAMADTGHGKRRAFVDLATDGGREQARSLLADADVFSQSYRAGSVERLGFGPDEVAAIRPGIIYVSTNCFGPRGPWTDKRGFDGNAMAASGIFSISPPDMSPDAVIAAMNDYCTGYWGAYGVLRALQLRAGQGGSYHVRVSLGQTASWFLRLGTPLDATAGLSGPEMIELAHDYMEEHPSSYGLLERLRPVIQMSETAPRWDRPTVLPGTHEAVWA
ncbi:MAG: CoA transferase [Dehalococcoidia bacterium]